MFELMCVEHATIAMRMVGTSSGVIISEMPELS
jgi:hypothetical protein